MCKVYPCPHCQTQNFATQARLRKARSVPLRCWKCGKEIKESSCQVSRRNRKERGTPEFTRRNCQCEFNEPKAKK